MGKLSILLIIRLRNNTSGKLPDESEIRSIIKSLDDQNRWLSKHEWVSSPYSVSETGEESNTALHADEVHTKGILDPSEQQYISVPVYIKNMNRLISYIKQKKD